MRRFVIDTDTASDDAVALVMALRDSRVRVDAVTVVQGNVPLDLALQAALYTVELCGGGVPVCAGLAKPLLRPAEHAQDVHGADGMGDIGLPLTGREPDEGHAVDQLLARFSAEPGEIELVTLGPLSNVAVALLREPRLAEWVKHCYIMGGASDGQGNIGLAGEFNVWQDPEAAKIVFESGMPITMIGWDPCRLDSVVTDADQASIRAVGTALADFAIDIQGTLVEYTRNVAKLDGISLADPLAMAVALEPATATATLQRFVTVSTDNGLTRGQTVVDHLDLLGRERNTTVVLRVDHERYLEMLHEAVR